MKKSFILYNDQQKLFDQLSDDEAGILIKAVFKYLHLEDGIEDGSINHYLNEDRMLIILFNTLIQQIERDRAKYAEKCRKLRENGSKGGKARADNVKQLQANPSLNDNDNDNDNVIPTLTEIQKWSKDYANENILDPKECLSLAQQAYEYYNMCMHDKKKRTWCDSNGKTIKNWKLKIARVWFKDLKVLVPIKVNAMNVC